MVIQEPQLIFVASQPLDVGDEMLFDYNDRDWKLAFVKSCPVCGDAEASGQQLVSDVNSRKRKQHLNTERETTDEPPANLRSDLWQPPAPPPLTLTPTLNLLN